MQRRDGGTPNGAPTAHRNHKHRMHQFRIRIPNPETPPRVRVAPAGDTERIPTSTTRQTHAMPVTRPAGITMTLDHNPPRPHTDALGTKQGRTSDAAATSHYTAGPAESQPGADPTQDPISTTLIPRLRRPHSGEAKHDNTFDRDTTIKNHKHRMHQFRIRIPNPETTPRIRDAPGGHIANPTERTQANTRDSCDPTRRGSQ